MAYKILPLYADKNYSYRISLGKASYKVEYTLNERQGVYHFSIYTDGNIPLTVGNALVPQAFTHILLPDNPGVFVLVPIISGTVFEDIPPARLGEFYNFVFFEEE